MTIILRQRNNRNTNMKLCYRSLVLMSITLGCWSSTVHSTESSTHTLSERQSDENSLARSANLEYPRQLFRLHILDSRSSNKNLSRNPSRLANNRKSSNHHQQDQSQLPTLSNSVADINAETSNQQPKSNSSSSSQSKNISNGTLKKLLTQALLRQQQQQQKQSQVSRSAGSQRVHNDSDRNLTSDINDNSIQSTPSNALKSNNFKFVFIQRAQASHHNNKTSSNSNDNKKHEQKDQAKNINPSSNQYDNQQAKLKPADTKTKAASLAVSVSKQLASSLLYSAASLMSNLTTISSQAPSINSLLTKTPDSTSFQQAQQESTLIGSDIQRLQTTSTTKQQPDGASSQDKGGEKKPSSSLDTTKRNPQRYKKNSKIYNLPVKFVSNGLPSQIVLLTIRQHLAAMKRLQHHQPAIDQGVVRHAPNTTNFSDSRSSSSSTSGPSLRDQLVKVAGLALSTSINNNQNNRNRSQSVKGQNSRLIYLPLKLLANGKASKISITGKVTHSSSSSMTANGKREKEKSNNNNNKTTIDTINSGQSR